LHRKKNHINFVLNGHDELRIRSLHGIISVSNQKFINKSTDESKTYFDYTDEFRQNYISERLQEYICWLSSTNSYANVEEQLQRYTGESTISDQKIQQIVLQKAVEISKIEALENEKQLKDVVKIEVVKEIDLYDNQIKEILLFEDGIEVKGQKLERTTKNKKSVSEVGKGKWHETNVSILECTAGVFRYITEGMDCEENENQGLVNSVKKEIRKAYSQEKEPLKLICITDGARKIRKDLAAILTVVFIILDWYHLRKKIRELLSMIAINKEEKNKHSNYIRSHCWKGEVAKAINYLKTEVKTKNEVKLKELIGYLEKHQGEIINYEKRKKAGLCVGSGRMESGVNQTVGIRQKNKGMAWSKKGSRALAILKVKQLNNEWDSVWAFNKAA